MKVEIAINGRFEVALLPEDAIDEAVLREMTVRAAKGKPVAMTGALSVEPDVASKVTRAVVSVER